MTGRQEQGGSIERGESVALEDRRRQTSETDPVLISIYVLVTRRFKREEGVAEGYDPLSCLSFSRHGAVIEV